MKVMGKMKALAVIISSLILAVAPADLYALEFVSVAEPSAILYDAPSVKAKKLVEQQVTFEFKEKEAIRKIDRRINVSPGVSGSAAVSRLNDNDRAHCLGRFAAFAA